MILLPVCFAGSRPAMTMLALAPLSIAVVSFDLRSATPVLHVATAWSGSSLHRPPSKQAFNAPRQQTASVEIPIASDAKPRHTFRGFLPWRFAYAGPGVRRATVMGPASANLHSGGLGAYSGPSSVETIAIVFCSTSKMTAVDHPNISAPFIAAMGPSNCQRSTGSTSP